MHSIVAEVPVQFEISVLVTLRVKGKTSLTEVVVDTVTTVFAPAVLAPGYSSGPRLPGNHRKLLSYDFFSQ